MAPNLTPAQLHDFLFATNDVHNLNFLTLFVNIQGANNKYSECLDLITVHNPAIWALAETHFHLNNDVFSFHDYISFVTNDKRKGVAMWIHKSYKPQHIYFPLHLQPNAAIVWALFHLAGEKIAVATVYCTQEGSQNRQFDNEALYANLQAQINFCKLQGYKLLVLGDFNAHISTNCGLWWNAGQVNRNGRMFLEFYNATGLNLLNAMLNALGRFTWSNNAGSQQSVIDFILASPDLSINRLYCDDFYNVLDVLSDHRVLAVSFNAVGPVVTPPQPKLYWDRRPIAQKIEAYNAEIHPALLELGDNITSYA